MVYSLHVHIYKDYNGNIIATYCIHIVYAVVTATLCFVELHVIILTSAPQSIYAHTRIPNVPIIIILQMYTYRKIPSERFLTWKSEILGTHVKICFRGSVVAHATKIQRVCVADAIECCIIMIIYINGHTRTNTYAHSTRVYVVAHRPRYFYYCL